ncbi:hypothetical protein K7472_07950 [Streptomyces sp. PTM05]|uniref:JmjC domain-containing protein n=1 Tax=Streptantibioticus parmotrematis TaxID=2873249 RepID=A0ABS7QSH9_9ACTN|nr:hypothetical protein [Streptantibioticus parmotrematis]MBY8884777.1 hypothetical protein [Streptantibioticus parmotrematis]
MDNTVETARDFTSRWHTPPNFRVAAGLVPFKRAFPDTIHVLDVARRDPETRVTILGGGDPAVRTAQSAAFRTAPLDEITTWPFRLAHFNLERFYDGLLRDFQERVMIPWRTFIASQGFTWLRCAPALFISSQGSSSTYHADNSHGLVWQIAGTKSFHSYRDPDRITPVEAAISGEITAEQPPPHSATDRHSIRMRPGDLAWSHVLTPHWVTSESPLAMSVTISHGGLCHQGCYAHRGAALRRHWDANPNEVWLTDLRNTRY